MRSFIVNSFDFFLEFLTKTRAGRKPEKVPRQDPIQPLPPASVNRPRTSLNLLFSLRA